MQVSVETLKGLERKLIVSVPTEKVEEEVSQRLKSLARKVKIDGFRPGNAPKAVVNQRYSDSVRAEVARDMVQSTLFEALQQENLTPAGFPSIEPLDIKPGEDFKYTATFEILPVFEVAELNKIPLELIRSEVKDKDIKQMLEKLREQNTLWIEVSHPAEKGNKVVIDFQGFLDDKPFEGGTAKNHELILGSGSMIPGFEEAIIGQEIGKEFDAPVKFPKDYAHADLAGKKTTFKMTIHKVMEAQLPELDDAFAEQFNIKTGGIEALSKDLKSNMERELEKRINILNKDKLFDKLMDRNPIDLPSALIEKEIEHLKHEAYHRIFGHEHHDNEKIPDFPRELFEAQAKRRVHLGLLFSEYVKKHNLVADPARVNAVIDQFASAYESPEEVRKLYRNNKEHLAEVEALVLEELVADKIASDATIKYVEKDYDSVMNPKTGTENKGE